jgi:hypothetical protein
MRFFAKNRRAQTWWVLLAFLMGVLAPTVTRAVNSSTSAGIALEICTSSGVKVITVSSSDTELNTLGKVQLDQCMYCILHGDLHALLGDDFVIKGVRSDFGVYTAPYFSADLPVFVWSVAYPRAPPATV